MQISDAQSDYLNELFTVGLEEVAERVAVITEHSVTISSPVLFRHNSPMQLAQQMALDFTTQGYIAELPLTIDFDGFGLMFFDKAQGQKFDRLLSDNCDNNAELKSLEELARVLLEQYAVVMTDLLNLTIDYDPLLFSQTSLAEHAALKSACEDDSICISMSFALNDNDIQCHIIFVHRPESSKLMDTVKSALADLGLT